MSSDTQRYDILSRSVGIDYRRHERNGVVFDYEGLMSECPYSVDEIAAIQARGKVGGTPLVELTNLTALARSVSPPGNGARIFIKDEANNPSGSFKDRRASIAVHNAVEGGFPGIVAATSGNYGAAIASQAALHGLPVIILQETFDSHGRGQPEIIEKTRKCEAYGAEVWQLGVGPELFQIQLEVLEETGFYNGSLYTPHAVAGIETLGREIAEQTRERLGRAPDAVVITHAGGGNVTGTARGLRAAGCTSTQMIGASVDLTGLRMASDADFNRKSFTTGHTGFGVPFAVNPDRVDVPRNAARSLRYLDRYVSVMQGDVFFITEALAVLEGLERGPAGNTSLCAAFAIAQEMKADQVLVVQESEYTGAGKHPTAQLNFAREMGVEVVVGDPADGVPGKRIVIPSDPGLISAYEIDLADLRTRYVERLALDAASLDDETVAFLAADTNWTEAAIREVVNGRSG